MTAPTHTAYSTKIEDKHHHTSPYTSAVTASVSQVEAPVVQHGISHIDRDSAIALGVILTLILLAIGYYVYLRLQYRREQDLEQQQQQQQQRRRSSIPTLRSYGTRGRAPTPSFHMERMWSRAVRHDSDSSTLQGSVSGEHKGSGKKGSWSSSSRGSVSTRVGSVDTTSNDPHGGPRSRSPSPRSQTRRKSSHRRTSSIASVPAPLLDSLQRQADKSWWADVARRGSTTHADRRFSVLEPIPEPHEMDISDGKRRKSEADWKRKKSVTDRSGYDWTRPSVAIDRIDDIDEEIDKDVIAEGSACSGAIRQDGFTDIRWNVGNKGRGPHHQVQVSEGRGST
ncbi:hypothetical protein HBI20_133410 [Parastagonospora nodorum]|nr:hypothetical protein HBI20_133410 [Parastagonospora nodorum]